MCKKREPLPYKTLFESVPRLWALRISHDPMPHPVLPVCLLDILSRHPTSSGPGSSLASGALDCGPVDPGRMSWDSG